MNKSLAQTIFEANQPKLTTIDEAKQFKNVDKFVDTFIQTKLKGSNLEQLESGEFGKTLDVTLNGYTKSEDSNVDAFVKAFESKYKVHLNKGESSRSEKEGSVYLSFVLGVNEALTNNPFRPKLQKNFEGLLKELKDLQDSNNHMEALWLIANYVKRKDLVKVFDAVMLLADYQNHMPDSLRELTREYKKHLAFSVGKTFSREEANEISRFI